MRNIGWWVRICGLSAALFPCVTLGQGSADAYPTKPVTLIIAFAPGGPVDREFRLYAPKLGSLLGQSFVTDFKPGAAGSIGAAYVARARPDGYTLLVLTTSVTAAAALYKDLAYDTVRDFAPISLINKRVPLMVAYPGFGPRNFKDYLAYARANPGRVNIGNSGAGGSGHLASAWMHNLAKVDVTFIHYKGAGPQLVDLIAGRVDVAVMAVLASLPLIKSGKVRPLVIMDDKRSGSLPEVPTAAEQGLTGFSYSNWLGIAAPGATPAAIVNSLSEAIFRVVKMPDVAGPLEAEGIVMVGSTPGQFKQVMITEVERWRKVVQDNHISLDE